MMLPVPKSAKKRIITVFIFFTLITNAFNASAVKIHGYKAESEHYTINGEVSISEQTPEVFNKCKTLDYTRDDVGFALKDFSYIVDKMTNEMTITNPSDIYIARIEVKYKNRSSAIIKEENVNVSIPPRGQKIFSLKLLRRVVEITAVRAYAMTKVICLEEYTDDELEDKEKKQRKEEEKLQEKAKRQAEKKEDYDEIYDNCMADKLPVTNNRELNKSVTNICRRIADDPSWWHWFWYFD